MKNVEIDTIRIRLRGADPEEVRSSMGGMGEEVLRQLREMPFPEGGGSRRISELHAGTIGPGENDGEGSSLANRLARRIYERIREEF